MKIIDKVKSKINISKDDLIECFCPDRWGHSIINDCEETDDCERCWNRECDK